MTILGLKYGYAATVEPPEQTPPSTRLRDNHHIACWSGDVRASLPSRAALTHCTANGQYAVYL